MFPGVLKNDGSVDLARLGDPQYAESVYRGRQLADAAAFGFGIGQEEKGPTDELLAETAKLGSSLSAYMRAAWHILEPARAFVPNWHLDAISEHLEAVTAGEIQRLLINIPPRCSKSLSVSVFWMTWEWTREPSTQWLFLTYQDDLCTRDSLKCRRLILSPWYQERWGHIYQLSQDQRTKVNFDNNRRGVRLAKTMIGSRGQGGDRIVIDDPHNTEAAESELMRRRTLRQWNEEVSTRHNDPETGATVVMMQRLHQKDVAGEILEKAEPGEWDHLMLPMRFDPQRRCVTSLGFKDPREKKGEWLWPERFPPDGIATRIMERKLGPYGVAGQWQQDPVAREGGQFERSWFLTDYDAVPRGSTMLWVRHWDMAGTEDGGAYTCGLLLGIRVTDGIVFIADVVRGQWGAANRNAQIKATAENDALRFENPVAGNGEIKPNKLRVLQRAEQEPGSGGKDQAKAFVRLLRGYRAETKTSSGDKFVRADPFAGAAKNGDIHVLPGAWRSDFLEEMEAAGPGAAYLDQMDSAAAAYNRIMELYDARRGVSLVGMNLSEMGDEFTQEGAYSLGR